MTTNSLLLRVSALDCYYLMNRTPLGIIDIIYYPKPKP